MTRLLSCALLVAACGQTSERAHRPPPGAEVAPSATIVVPPRSGVLKRYPCSECHDKFESRQPETPPREPHTDKVLAHMPNVNDCYQCHDPFDMDHLRLLSGQKVEFDDTHEVCGQCHPAKRDDWKLGIHGKQVGSWRTVTHRYACPDCHDPHAPARPTMIARPPPPFPELGIVKEPH